MQRLVLIDGNAVLHRAFHAIPPLTAPDGSVVNAVYGFTTMLIRIVHDLAPTHLAVAFDRPKPTFRKELFAGYQAKRPEMDETLVPQIEKVHDVVRALGVQIFEMDGFEADDVIGTLCQLATGDRGQGTGIDQVIIVTGDRDILQLVVDEKVLVYMPTKGLSEAKLYGKKEVVERMGVPPTQVADLKALSGDSSDNYPGVAGIGPKTAVGLLAQFGSTEALYEAIQKKDKRLEQFSTGVLAKLATGTKDAVLFKEIASIRRDVPIEVAFDACKVTTLNTEEGRAALLKFGFQSLIKRLALDKSGKFKVQSEKLENKKEQHAENKKIGEQQELF